MKFARIVVRPNPIQSLKSGFTGISEECVEGGHLIGLETLEVLRGWIKGVMRVKAVETENQGSLLGPNEFDGLFGDRWFGDNPQVTFLTWRLIFLPCRSCQSRPFSLSHWWYAFSFQSGWGWETMKIIVSVFRPLLHLTIGTGARWSFPPVRSDIQPD